MIIFISTRPLLQVNETTHMRAHKHGNACSMWYIFGLDERHIAGCYTSLSTIPNITLLWGFASVPSHVAKLRSWTYSIQNTAKSKKYIVGPGLALYGLVEVKSCWHSFHREQSHYAWAKHSSAFTLHNLYDKLAKPVGVMRFLGQFTTGHNSINVQLRLIYKWWPFWVVLNVIDVVLPTYI